MKIVKIKGQPNRFFYEDVKMSFQTGGWCCYWARLKITLPEGEILGRLRRLPKTNDLKRVFYRECNNKKLLFPFPQKIDDAPPAPLPRGEFVGDVLLRADNTVENVVLKFVLEGERVIPFNEWLSLIQEIHDRINETGENEGIVLWDEVNDLCDRCYNYL